jgi:hypothetical membrane protein
MINNDFLHYNFIFNDGVIMKLNNWSLSSLTGLLAVLIFCLFTFTAAALFPGLVNPLYVWLSNLGNVELNPNGAIFFNLGCIITGLILIPFFIGLYKWNLEKTWGKILLILGIVLGLLASLSLIMVGVFPETHIKQHVMAASGVFGLLFIIIILLSISLYNHPKFANWVAFFGLIAVIIDLAFKYLLSQYHDILAVLNPTIPVPGLEWASVFASLVWVGLLAYIMKKNQV